MNTVNYKLSEDDARHFIAAKHKEYFDILHSFARRMNIKPPELPTFTIVDCVFRHCGQYDPSKHDLQYSIPYCVYLGDEYSETIAHEMAHAFQRSLKYGDTWHGTTFLWLLAECGVDVSDKRKAIYHSYNVLAVDRVAEQLKAERGGYSNHITMQPVRRKSLKEMIAERNRNAS